MRDHFQLDTNELAERLGLPAWQFTYAMESYVDFFDPLRIYLFGSHAWGKPHSMSDLDICVIVPDGEPTDLDRCIKAMSLLDDYVIAQWEKGPENPLKILPVDLLLIDRAYFESRISNPATLESKIYRKGKLVYARPDLVFKGATIMIHAETQWIKHANNGLEIAQILFDRQESDYRVNVLLHVHQCIEMALCGYLAFQLQEVQKDHSILSLFSQCAMIDPDFKQYIKDGRRITKFFYLRYLPEEPIPERNKVLQEIWYADEILKLVKDKIANLPRPSTPPFLPEPPEVWEPNP